MPRPLGIGLLPSIGLLLAACNDQGFALTDKGNPPAGPAIRVSPPLVEFGTLGQDDEPLVKTFLVESVGSSDLTVSGIELYGDAGSFALLSDAFPIVLPAGASQEIEVAFIPEEAYEQMGQAVVDSDDPEQPQSLVELLGAGAVPELEIQPDPVDFGQAWVGCDDQLDVYLANVGTDDLVISGLRYEGDEAGVFSEALGLTLPMTLAPGERAQVLLDFLPLDAIPYEGNLVVESNEPTGERVGQILGEGAWAAEYLDRWELPWDPPSDIVFLVDQSQSMDDDQRRLGDNFSTFISSLAAYTSDWQIAVINDDNGCSNSGLLTSATSGYAAIFQAAVASGGGNWTESLLSVATTGIEKTDSGECNFGFLREDAMLHLIFVSDEPEQSPGTWSTYVNQIVAKKGSASNVRMSGVVGPAGAGSCAQPGTGYHEAIAATGGVQLDICSDWATEANLAELAEASVFQDSYELTHSPVIETIRVEVNGIERSSGWSYDPGSNTVLFSADVPTEGAEVEISYAGLATCD